MAEVFASSDFGLSAAYHMHTHTRTHIHTRIHISFHVHQKIHERSRRNLAESMNTSGSDVSNTGRECKYNGRAKICTAYFERFDEVLETERFHWRISSGDRVTLFLGCL